jgi:hypothetical protein
VETCIFRFADDAHPPAAELLDNAVVRDHFAEKSQLCFGVRRYLVLGNVMTDRLKSRLLQKVICLLPVSDQ